MSETKQYDFQDLADYLQGVGLALRSTGHMNLAGMGETTLLRKKGADELATNLVRIGGWLGRLEEYLNHADAASSTPPWLTVTPSAVQVIGGSET